MNFNDPPPISYAICFWAISTIRPAKKPLHFLHSDFCLFFWNFFFGTAANCTIEQYGVPKIGSKSFSFFFNYTSAESSFKLN